MAPPTVQNDLFLRACRRQSVSRTPVWMMRQAGRYLPEYRAVRERYDFLTMCKTPDVVADVTVQPVDLVGVDAAILFSDIMVIPEAMGMDLEMVESRGPVLHDPIRSDADIERLRTPDPTDHLGYVLDGIRATNSLLAGRVPLIGFSGSPWTLFVYMVEGSGSKNYRYPKSMIYNEPAMARRLLDRITDAVADYMLAQIDAGVHAVQIFDTWGGILPPPEYREFSLPYIRTLVERLSGAGVPVIAFSKDCSHSLEAIADTGADVVGIDWRTDLGEARRRVGDRVALQGNLDPVTLFASREEVTKRVHSVLDSFGEGDGHIFNLGHGILPETPVENAKAVIEAVAMHNARTTS
jgi:uroporphyrinogen decarboxylase